MSPFHDIWIESLKTGFLSVLQDGSPSHIDSQKRVLLEAGVPKKWVDQAMLDALQEQIEFIPLDKAKRIFHSIRCTCEKCKAPVEQGRKVLSGEQVEGEKKKSGSKSTAPAAKPRKRLI